MRKIWIWKSKKMKERVRDIKTVKRSFEIGGNGSEDYRTGFVDGMEMAIALCENRNPDLMIAKAKKENCRKQFS